MRQKMLLLCITLFLFLAGLLLIHPAAATNESPTDSSSTLKIIAYQETLAAGAGIMPWHDYGSYKLYKLSHEAWAQLPQTIREQFYPASYMDQLHLNAYAFNTQEETAVIPLNLRPKTVEQGNNLHLIQFVGPIKDEWLRSVEKTGTELVHYVAENGYLVWTDENGRSQLRKMAAKGDFLQYSAPYQAAFKLDPVFTTELGNWQKEIKNKGHGKSANSSRKPQISNSSYFQEFSAVYLSNNSTDQSSVTVTIQLYRNNNQKTSEAIIAGLAEETFGDWQPILNYQNLRATLPLDAVWQIAQLPDVVWVGQYTPPQKMDEVQGQIMAAQLGNANGTPTGPGYLAWLNSLGFSQNPADYPIVDITDDGIGNGDANSAGGDVTLRQQGNAANPSRLAYIDYPGMIGVNPKVNDLNLSLKYNNAAYWGNQFEGQWSVPDGEADSANNVEAIFLPPGNGGQFTITVTGFNIASDGVPGNSDPTDQDFALVCVNCLTEPDFILTVEPERQAICQSENAAYTLTASPLGGFNTPVNLSVANLPAGLTAVFSTNPVQLPGSSILTLSNAQQAAPGTSFVQVTGSAGGKNHTINLDLVIDAEPPEAVELISPANGSQNLPTPVILTWTTAAHASEYNIQIAADVDFKNIIEETAGLTTTTYTPANLASGKRYFWRVIPTNGCGENYSDTFTFTTEPEPGECPVDMTTAVLYSEGFENSAAGWTHAGTNDTWRRSTERAHAGEYAFFAQDLPVISDQRLTSPRFDLPTGLPIINLKFWNYYDIEIDLADNSYCYDGGILEISTDNGASWQQLVDPSPDAPIFLTNPYTGIIKNNIQNPLAGLEAWCGSTETWKQTIVALDAYGDESVTIRFRLGTDNSVEREGWHIDQVELQTCQMIYPPDQTTAYLPLVK